MAAAGLKPEYEVKQTKTNDFCFENLELCVSFFLDQTLSRESWLAEDPRLVTLGNVF